MWRRSAALPATNLVGWNWNQSTWLADSKHVSMLSQHSLAFTKPLSWTLQSWVRNCTYIFSVFCLRLQFEEESRAAESTERSAYCHVSAKAWLYNISAAPLVCIGAGWLTDPWSRCRSVLPEWGQGLQESGAPVARRPGSQLSVLRRPNGLWWQSRGTASSVQIRHVESFCVSLIFLCLDDLATLISDLNFFTQVRKSPWQEGGGGH